MRRNILLPASVFGFPMVTSCPMLTSWRARAAPRWAMSWPYRVSVTVAAKLNVLRMAEASGAFAQNIDFAIETTLLATFLEANQMSMQPGVTTGASSILPALQTWQRP